MTGFFRNLYFNTRAYYVVAGLVIMFILGAFWPFVFPVSLMAFTLFMVALLADIALVFSRRQGLVAERFAPPRLSNGDNNDISVRVKNLYGYACHAEIIDDIPARFQRRDLNFKRIISPGGEAWINYILRPVERGEYAFGNIHAYAATFLGLVSKRYSIPQEISIPVYPSFLQMRQYELAAISDKIMAHGLKRVRKIGHTMEFEQVRKYVTGDDFRTVNWKATARHNELMVNQYQDEKSQNVYSIIDMGRVMKMPFNGMSLLDYSINSALAISNIANLKQDKAGLITFSQKIDSVVPANSKKYQMMRIMETLYAQETRYMESNWPLLYAGIRRSVNKRSLLLIYTNFETLSAMRRNMQYLAGLAKYHLVVVIFFKNTELYKLIDSDTPKLRQVYSKIIAERLAFEKINIAKELNNRGIMTIYTSPESLTANTINKYLEIKNRRLL